jgi:hypothetical protein
MGGTAIPSVVVVGNRQSSTTSLALAAVEAAYGNGAGSLVR